MFFAKGLEKDDNTKSLGYSIQDLVFAHPAFPEARYDIFEGGAAALESLWIQQTFGYNYFYDQNQHNAQQAIESPELFEDPHNDLAIDDNYSNSIFLFLANKFSAISLFSLEESITESLSSKYSIVF